jgi:hypothetical protein
MKSRRMSWTGLVVRKGEEADAYRSLVGKSKGKRPLERPRCMWEDKLDLREIGWCGVDWIALVQDRDKCSRSLVNTVMNFQVRLMLGNY